MAEQPEAPPFDPNMPLDQLWGLTLHDVTVVMVYGLVGAALLGSLGFSIIAVFARRWKAGLWVLLAVLAFEALPLSPWVFALKERWARCSGRFF